jgi:hypothetical protein
VAGCVKFPRRFSLWVVGAEFGLLTALREAGDLLSVQMLHDMIPYDRTYSFRDRAGVKGRQKGACMGMDGDQI